MEVFIRDEDMPKNCGECPCANYSAYRDVLWCDLTGNELEDSAIKEKEAKPFCPLKSIDQHDLEIRADERKKVVAELELKYTMNWDALCDWLGDRIASEKDCENGCEYKPEKGSDGWLKCGYGNLGSLESLFQFIKWADEEPYKIQELLEEYENLRSE